jgi:hypothetical protein
MDEEFQERLVPVGRRLREELNRYGEHVTHPALIDPVKGRIWKKNPTGALREVTVDSKKVLLALEYTMILSKQPGKNAMNREKKEYNLFNVIFDTVSFS